MAGTHSQDMLIRFGKNIKELREAKGWSQERLAEMVGYKSRTSINKIEMGKTDIGQKMISKIADALGVASSVLIDTEEEAKGKEAATEAADLSEVKSKFIASVLEMTDQQVLLLQAVIDQVLLENGQR